MLTALLRFPSNGLRGERCGTDIGSLMGVGPVYGRDDLEDRHAYLGSLPSTRRFARRFEEFNGSTMCEFIFEAKPGRKFNLANPG